jgi:hypothetical protein
MADATVKVYASKTNDYHDAFKVFLDHTDQKAKAREFLDGLVARLASRRVFIDAGAGNGKVTAWYTPSFEKTVAIEPNDSLRVELRAACPGASVLGEPILEANPNSEGDFVLCSHVLYYIDQAGWMPTVERLASWLSPEGTLSVIIQNHGSDCMKMLQAFFGHHYNLSKFAEDFGKRHEQKYEVSLDVIPAHVTTGDFESAYTVAEFMLNLVPIKEAPPRKKLEAYVRQNFRNNGGYKFSCDQSFLQIRKK